MTDHDILNLRCRPVPPEVTAVEGCDCGGSSDVHRTDCSIWRLPREQAMAAVADAERRMREHTDELNRRLRAALGTQEQP